MNAPITTDVVATTAALPAPHGLGPVADDWEAA